VTRQTRCNFERRGTFISNPNSDTRGTSIFRVDTHIGYTYIRLFGIAPKLTKADIFDVQIESFDIISFRILDISSNARGTVTLHTCSDVTTTRING